MAKVPKQQAIEQVRNAARMFQAVIDLADSLGEVASTEEALAAAKLSLAQARDEHAKVGNEVITLREHVSALGSSILELESKAASIIHEAKVEANAKAKHIVDDAQTKANVLLDEATASRVLVFSACQEMEARRNLLQAELRTLHDKIDNAKAAMAKMLGA